MFANIVLGDEINRASPKTQSALLEVMQEQTVTTDATVYRVPRPFVVVATQNPIDLEGTYVLPEAQLDRFLMRIEIGYPAPEAEAQVLRTERDEATVANLSPVMTGDELLEMVEFVKRTVEVAPAIENYIVAICAHTRDLARGPSGRLAPRRAGPAAGGSGRGRRGRAVVRHPRGRQGDGPGHARPPGDPPPRCRGPGPHRAGGGGPGAAGRAGAPNPDALKRLVPHLSPDDPLRSRRRRWSGWRC